MRRCPPRHQWAQSVHRALSHLPLRRPRRSPKHGCRCAWRRCIRSPPPPEPFPRRQCRSRWPAEASARPTGNATCAKRRVASRSRWNAAPCKNCSQSFLRHHGAAGRAFHNVPASLSSFPAATSWRGAARPGADSAGRVAANAARMGFVPAGTCVAQRGHTVCPPALGRKHDDVRFDFDSLTPAARSARLDTAPARRFVQRRARCDFPGARRALVRAVPRSTAAPARPHRALTGLAFALPRPSR